ncbi:hypothetical protein HaLaN_04723 [Haematococcus lacustris]|uniref:Uncharacterized protein n=1 Tax=Haematococcus lacustris TaxID=44745 RepID=A0A699YRY2_HAELA|nr:hypothetical protein HaLaN_04723 [Haematococcus lacustris]
MASGTSVVTGLAFLVSSQLGAARLGQLVSLHIDTCKQLRDEQLGQALGLCPALRPYLRPRADGLDDPGGEGHQALAGGCPGLQQLDLGQCCRLSAVSCLAACPLTALSLKGLVLLLGSS